MQPNPSAAELTAMVDQCMISMKSKESYQNLYNCAQECGVQNIGENDLLLCYSFHLYPNGMRNFYTTKSFSKVGRFFKAIVRSFNYLQSVKKLILVFFLVCLSHFNFSFEAKTLKVLQIPVNRFHVGLTFLEMKMLGKQGGTKKNVQKPLSDQTYNFHMGIR